MDIFSFDAYREYLRQRIKAMPNKGHGQFTRMAESIGISPVVITQVLKGDRDFTEEQGHGVAQFLGLQNLETEYFLRLIAVSRAGKQELKQFHLTALENMRKQANEIKNRVKISKELDDANKSIFYSDWTYSAVRLLTSMDKFANIDAIAEHLQLNRTRVAEIVEFLLAVGLCTQDEKGRLKLGVTSTYLEPQSRFANNHRRNLRLKGLEAINHATTDELFFSAPCTLSLADFQLVKQEMTALVSSLYKRVPESKPEVLACLNMDWFQI